MLAPRCGPVQDGPVRPYTTAACFAAYLLPHVLFVADADERGRVAHVCNLAWNIALFPTAAERERHVQATADLVARDAEGGDAETGPPPPGLREGFAGELATLVALKRDLFPWQAGLITRADLAPAPGGRGNVDVLGILAAALGVPEPPGGGGQGQGARG